MGVTCGGCTEENNEFKYYTCNIQSESVYSVYLHYGETTNFKQREMKCDQTDDLYLFNLINQSNNDKKCIFYFIVTDLKTSYGLTYMHLIMVLFFYFLEIRITRSTLQQMKGIVLLWIQLSNYWHTPLKNSKCGIISNLNDSRLKQLQNLYTFTKAWKEEWAMIIANLYQANSGLTSSQCVWAFNQWYT